MHWTTTALHKFLAFNMHWTTTALYKLLLHVCTPRIIKPTLDFVWFVGCKLSEHQELAGSDLPDSGRYDQGKNSWGNPQDIQYQEWLHTRGRGGGSQGEPMGFWVNVTKWSDLFFLWLMFSFVSRKGVAVSTYLRLCSYLSTTPGCCCCKTMLVLLKPYPTSLFI